MECAVVKQINLNAEDGNSRRLRPVDALECILRIQFGSRFCQTLVVLAGNIRFKRKLPLEPIELLKFPYQLHFDRFFKKGGETEAKKAPLEFLTFKE